MDYYYILPQCLLSQYTCIQEWNKFNNHSTYTEEREIRNNQDQIWSNRITIAMTLGRTRVTGLNQNTPLNNSCTTGSQTDHTVKQGHR